MRIAFLPAVAALVCSAANAQTVDVQQPGAPWLSNIETPRSTAMGGAGAAIATGNDALFINPAGLAQLRKYHLEVDGVPVTLAQHGGEWLTCVAGLAIAMLVVFIVLPLAVLLPLLLVAFILCAVFAGLAALAFSPVLLLAGLVWLIWRIARGAKRSPGGTMARP